MGIVIFIALGLFVLAGLGLAVFGWARSRQPGSVLEDRLAEFGTLERPPTLEEIELSQPFSERVLLPLITNLAEFAMRLSPQKSTEALQHKLDLAGNPYNLTTYMGIRVLAAFLFGGLGVALFFLGKTLPLIQRILLPAVGVGLGFWILPPNF